MRKAYGVRFMAAMLATALSVALISACGGGATSTPSAAEGPSATSTELESTPGSSAVEPGAVPRDARAAALNALLKRQADMRTQLWVYRDFSDAENHFSQRAKMWGESESAMHDLEEDCDDHPHSGTTCIRCSQDANVRDWGGWMFENGYVPEGQTEAVLNDTSASNKQGMDLTGARRLSFWARGEQGGERVDFFCLGFGWEGEGATAHRIGAYADSAPQLVMRDVVLTDDWSEYHIDIDEGTDLSSVALGFGYSIDYSENAGVGGVNTFYLDDIRYEGDIECQQIAPMLLRSYDTEQIEVRNAAFTYDNALAALAFTESGRSAEAQAILDAFVYAVQHDRQEPGRIRNAYAAGDISPTPGWGAGAKLPGWYDVDAASWYEDAYQVGSNVGNTCYAMLALLHGYDNYHREDYLQCARQLGDWILAHCQDGRDGFTAGVDGWLEDDPSKATWYHYKSTEHNIDAYAAFKSLHAMTGDERYGAAEKSALAFVTSMYDEQRGLFYTGTGEDGVTPETDNIALDAQVWSALSLLEEFEPYRSALAQLDAMRTKEGGYRFHACAQDGYWCEGTAFTMLLLTNEGMSDQSRAADDVLTRAQLDDGLFPAASIDGLETGIYLSDGSPWVYGRVPHVAPTAWYVLACDNYNPYEFL